MLSTNKLKHSEWDCKYHIVFIPRYRRKVLYCQLRQHLGDLFRGLALERESRIKEGHLMPESYYRIWCMAMRN